MLKPHDKTFQDVKGDSHEYRLLELQAELGFDLAAEIMEIGSEVLGKLAHTSLEVEGEEADLADAAAIGEGMRALAIQMQKKGGHKFIKRFLKDIYRDGKQFHPQGVESDKHWGFNTYSANYGELVQVLAWILEVNFKSFFGGYLGDLLAFGQEMAETIPSPEPTDSNEPD